MSAALAYTADELAGLLRVSARHVRRMGDAGEIPMVRLGGRRLFPKAAVERWLDEASTSKAAS